MTDAGLCTWSGGAGYDDLVAWKGKRVDDMTRAEAIRALREMARILQKCEEELHDTRYNY